MALQNETNEQNLLNIIQGGQPLTPQQFASYIYQGAPGDHAAATQRGLEYLQQAGLAPQAGVNLWNQALGTQFTLDDYYRVTGQQPPVTPSVPPTAAPTTPFTTTAAPTQNVVAPVQNFAEPQINVLQSLRDAGLKYQPISVAQDSQFQLPVDQPSFETTQPVTQQAVTQQPVTQQVAEKPTTNPNWFRDYIYQGGADDATATQRGIDYVLSEGMRPQDAVNLWNQSLGTNFSVTDLFNQTGSGPVMSNFGDSGSWGTGEKAEHDPVSGMIKSAGSYFQRGNESVVSDELFWNPNSPTGKELQQRIEETRNQGQRPGIVITPYAVFQGKATNEQLLNEVANSGADFVALDPYLGWGVPADKLYEWTKDFIPKLNALGKEVKLVTQGFAKKGEEDAANSYNQQLLALPGISEFVNFGLEDWFPEGSKEAQELFASNSEWVPLKNDFKQKEERRTTGKPPEDRKVALNESTPPTRMAHGGGIGSLAYRMKR